MGSSKRLAELYDRYAAEKHLARLLKEAPLQSLTSREVELDRLPVTIYPRPGGCQGWVRIGPHAVRVSARVVRTTPRAAGIEFVVEERTVRCWVWGSAVDVEAADEGA
ncbi:hypothetical protein GCM10025863_19660 [Microbacterium suwonense]|uniref:Uncharacterized protein n=1 Tax=Microbacterium suwonense TaxID=683047 RepID=A0ABN6X3R6_9MICO|nr:hypothetical protein GCM10025863_19660 [Microbacterium suwonense]